jgi:hypothetical protein
VEDPDGDGRVDAGESDPNLYDNFEGLHFSIRLSNTHVRVSYRRPAGPPDDISFALESTADFSAWDAVGGAPDVINLGDDTESVGHHVEDLAPASAYAVAFRMLIGMHW